MRSFFFSIITFILLTTTCSPRKAQNTSFNDFFLAYYISFYSLANFIGSDKILIYDPDNRLKSKEVLYQLETGSKLQSIQIFQSIPEVDNYILLTDLIVDENLAVISFANSAKKKYIIYTFTRDKKDKSRWNVLSVNVGSMN